MSANAISKDTFCKLTGRDLTTRGGFLWEPGTWHEITYTGFDTGLCSGAFFHFYTHPLLAPLYNIAHADIDDPVLWSVNVGGEVIHEFDKSGAKRMLLVDQIELPVITVMQMVAIAILYAKGQYPGEEWNSWADRWLSGEDRTEEAAQEAGTRAIQRPARSAAWAAAWAAVWDGMRLSKDGGEGGISSRSGWVTKEVEAWVVGGIGNGMRMIKASREVEARVAWVLRYSSAGSKVLVEQERLIDIIRYVLQDHRFQLT